MVFLRLCRVVVPRRTLRMDRIFASGCGICIAMGRLLLGQNVFLERIGFASREKITSPVLSKSLIPQGGKAVSG